MPRNRGTVQSRRSRPGCRLRLGVTPRPGPGPESQPASLHGMAVGHAGRPDPALPVGLCRRHGRPAGRRAAGSTDSRVVKTDINSIQTCTSIFCFRRNWPGPAAGICAGDRRRPIGEPSGGSAHRPSRRRIGVHGVVRIQFQISVPFPTRWPFALPKSRRRTAAS
jgi:hypothetical protein